MSGNAIGLFISSISLSPGQPVDYTWHEPALKPERAWCTVLGITAVWDWLTSGTAQVPPTSSLLAS